MGWPGQGARQGSGACKGFSPRAADTQRTPALQRPAENLSFWDSHVSDFVVHPVCEDGLDPHRALFREIIEQNGDITMPELASALFDATGIRAHPDAIGRFLRKLGFAYKSRWSLLTAAVPR